VGTGDQGEANVPKRHVFLSKLIGVPALGKPTKSSDTTLVRSNVQTGLSQRYAGWVEAAPQNLSRACTLSSSTPHVVGGATTSSLVRINLVVGVAGSSRTWVRRAPYMPCKALLHL
jgi:hypothetical protein